MSGRKEVGAGRRMRIKMEGCRTPKPVPWGEPGSLGRRGPEEGRVERDGADRVFVRQLTGVGDGSFKRQRSPIGPRGCKVVFIERRAGRGDVAIKELASGRRKIGR